MKKKLMTVTVHHLDGSSADTIVWGGDDTPSGASARGHQPEQKVLFTQSVTLPNGVKIDSIIWGS